MNKNWFARNQGQSVLLIALVLAALILIVGLAVDAGNAYAAQRKVQSTANAAAIAGTKRLAMARDNPGSYTDVDIRAEIDSIVLQNGFQPGDIIAEYLDANGNSLGYVGALGGTDTPPPEKAAYIRVYIGTKVDTYFVRIAGFPQIGVDAATRAQNVSIGAPGCTDCIYPIAVYDQGFERGVVYWIWDDEDPEYPGNFGWLHWRDCPGCNDTKHLIDSLTAPGNIADPDVGYWDGETHILGPGRIMFGKTGLSDAKGVDTALDYFINSEEPMILPLWKDASGQGQNVIYTNDGFALWRLEEVCFHHNDCDDIPEWMPPNVKALQATFLGYSLSGCTVSVPVPPGEAGGAQDYATAEGLVYLCTPQVTLLPPDEGAHLPVDLIHMVDSSLSMGSPLVGGGRTKIEVEKEALVYFNGLMRPDLGDRLGLVKFYKYNQDVTVLSNLTSDIGYLNSRIQEMQPNGYTPWAKAVLVGTATLFGQGRNPDNKPVLIVASDGAPTVDLDNEFNGDYQHLIWDDMSPESLRYCFEEDTCDNCCPWCTAAICPGGKPIHDPKVEVLIDALDAADVVKGLRTVEQTWWVQRHGGTCTYPSCPYYGVQAHPEMEIFVIAIKGDSEFSSSVLKYVATDPDNEHYFEVYNEQDVEDIYTFIANAISGQLPYCYIHSQETIFTGDVTFQIIAGGAVIGEGGSLGDGSYIVPDIPVDPYLIYGITGTVSYEGMGYGAAMGCGGGQLGAAMPLPETYQIPIFLVPEASPQCPEGTIPIPDPNP